MSDSEFNYTPHEDVVFMSDSQFPKIKNPKVSSVRVDPITEQQNMLSLAIDYDLKDHIREVSQKFDEIDERILVSVLLSRGFLVIPDTPGYMEKFQQIFERHGIPYLSRGDAYRRVSETQEKYEQY